MPIQPGSRIVFTGDSITDCGRGRPVGSCEDDSLGGGYVALLDWIMVATGAARRCRVLNTGVSGDTVRDLAGRWQRDVVALKPDWVSVMIGINDVWRQFDSDPATITPVTLGEYGETLARLLDGLRGAVRCIALIPPFYLEMAPGDPMRAMRDRYAEVAERIATSVGATVVDAQGAFDRALKARPREALAPDGVHPTGLGHMVLAQAWLESVVGPPLAAAHPD
ncbi:MAG: SGNH/GDSL hydrolase family protein [Armatimonadetes bacterium]|nr:SGNH/GDSL hydrolase family protein [Armatimonadota bacterium]